MSFFHCESFNCTHDESYWNIHSSTHVHSHTKRLFFWITSQSVHESLDFDLVTKVSLKVSCQLFRPLQNLNKVSFIKSLIFLPVNSILIDFY